MNVIWVLLVTLAFLPVQQSEPFLHYEHVEGVCDPRGVQSVFLVNPNSRHDVRATVHMTATYQGRVINRQERVHYVPAGERENMGCARWRTTSYRYEIRGWTAR